MKKYLFSMVWACLALVALTGCDGQKWSEQQVDSFMLVTQKGSFYILHFPFSILLPPL